MTDLSFLSPLPQAQDIALQTSPPKPTSDVPPLIILDDYSTVQALPGPSAEDHPEPPALPESSSTRALFPHSDYSASGDSDSDMLYAPSSGVPSETSSAGVSESDLPSAVASEADLPSKSHLLTSMPKSHLRSSIPKKQTGIYDFFWPLTEDEVEASRAKRKRTGSDEEADRAARREKEEEKREKKLAVRREGNRLAQQRYRKKRVEIDIKSGIRDSDGKRIPVS